MTARRTARNRSPEKTRPPSGRIGFVSLGCPKALVDSERILTQLRVEGYETVGSYEAADVVVVNTCGFIDSAIEESLDAIGEAMNENGRVVVTGCLGARADFIRERFPDVLSVSGPAAYEQVVNAVHEVVPPPSFDPRFDLVPAGGVRLTPRHYAYLKISEGCNHHCSFCIIPSMRGKLVSRRISDVLAEAESLAKAGVTEVLVISQDTSAYGADLRYRQDSWRGRTLANDLPSLARELGGLLPWVRLHYVYPYPNVDALVPLMAEGLVLPYLDVPLQHGVPRILKAMRRPAATDRTLARIARWREICPDLTIRSTFIVGFPGETDADFEALLEFLSAAQLDRVGCFAYSPVEGAAANALPGAVPETVKEERRERFMVHQSAISTARLAAKVGRTLEVVVDSLDERGAIGRTRGDAPEIDGVVRIESRRRLVPGERVDVRITASDAHDLEGHAIEAPGKSGILARSRG